MTPIYDAIVIGAGPAGAMAARTLTQEKRSVLLLEKGEHPNREKACGGLLPRSVFSKYHLDETLIERTTEDEVFVFPWDTRKKRHPLVAVDRSRFDSSLTQDAVGRGAELRSRTTVRAVERLGEHHFAVQAEENGQPVTFESQVVIFTDGVNSLAHKSFGIGFEKRPDNTAVGMEYSFSAPENGVDTYWVFFNQPQFFSTWGYFWVVPNSDTLNAGAFFPQDQLVGAPDALKTFEEWITEGGPPEVRDLLQDKPLVRKMGAQIPMQPAKLFVGDGVLAAGDAAGLVFPLRIAGMDLALLSGQLAGSVAARALKDKKLTREHMIHYEETIKGSTIYAELTLQWNLYRMMKRLHRLDRHAYAKTVQLYRLKKEVPLVRKAQILLYRDKPAEPPAETNSPNL